MKKLLFFSIIFLAAFASEAQPLSGRNTFAQMLETGDAQFELKDYVNALDWYEKALAEEPKNTYLSYRAALCHYNLRDYAKAEQLLSKVQRMDERDKDDANNYEDVPLALARVKKSLEKYDEAIAILEKLAATSGDAMAKKLIATELEGAKLAKISIAPEMLKVDNAGTDVNCPTTDFSPTSAKAGELFFVSNRAKGAIEEDGKTDAKSKVVMASLDGKGVWANTKLLDQVVNREGAEATSVVLSPNGNTMYFTRATRIGHIFTASQLFLSKRERNGWGPAIEVKGLTNNVKHPATGELFGKEVLFFTSDAEGTKGGDDIFYATKKVDGVYEYPVNLGDVINTAGDESSPFYRDGKLYFSSTGHAGMGGYDIFVASWDGTGWSKPSNLGRSYNSGQDDRSFSVDAEGNGFLSSNRVGGAKAKGYAQTCCDDIWTVTMEKMKLNLNVVVLDKNKKPLNGTTVQIIEMTDNKPGKTDNKNNPTGNTYDAPLAFEKSYMMVTCKEGYICDTTYFNSVGIKKTSTIDKMVVLKARPADPKFVKFVTKETIKQGGAIRMNNIYYDYDDDKILTDSEGDLNSLADIMREYPSIVVELSSHTDARGNGAYNQKLSQRRAESGVRYLVEKQGIARERLTPKGYGETVILNRCLDAVKDCTDEEHRFNRRTEFKIIGGATEKEVERTIITAKKWADCNPEEKKAGVSINDDEYTKIMKANAPKKN